MEDDERTMDWAAREAAKDQRAAEEEAKATEKSNRDARLKDKGGLELFKELHAWVEGQAKSYSAATPTKAFEVEEIKQIGGADCHHSFTVSSTKSERLPMTISYRSPPAPHGITVESPVQLRIQYPLSVGDDGNLFFETPKGQPTTIAELGSELLVSWRSARM